MAGFPCTGIISAWVSADVRRGKIGTKTLLNTYADIVARISSNIMCTVGCGVATVAQCDFRDVKHLSCIESVTTRATGCTTTTSTIVDTYIMEEQQALEQEMRPCRQPCEREGRGDSGDVRGHNAMNLDGASLSAHHIA